MDWKKLNSSHLSAAAYDEQNETLYVQFKNGRKYGYEGVPEDLANQFFQATDSHGKFFQEYILKNFQGTEITES